jgi:hypothetical protein
VQPALAGWSSGTIPSGRTWRRAIVWRPAYRNPSENKIAFGPVCKELGAGDGIAPANQASEFTTEFDVFRFAIG